MDEWWWTRAKAQQYLDDHADKPDDPGDPDVIEQCRATLDTGSAKGRLTRADPPTERGKPRPPID